MGELNMIEDIENTDNLIRRYKELIKRIDISKLAKLIEEPLIRELNKHSYIHPALHGCGFEIDVPKQIVLTPSTDITITVYFRNASMNNRDGLAGVFGANITLDVRYHGKGISIQNAFLKNCSEDNIKHAEEQVKMFEEVYDKVKEIYGIDIKVVKIVSNELNLTEEDVQKYCKEVPEIDGYYFWNPTRGGLSVIINHQGERLCATSSISFKEHLKAFIDGKRN